MNIPNSLSLFRIILVPVTIILLIDGEFTGALISFTLAAVTDALDGFLARILKQQTVLGAYLDPIADKTLLTGCFLTLAILKIIPGWLTAIVVTRDFIILFGISLLFMISGSLEIRPAFVSKVTTALQLVTIFLVLLLKSIGGPGYPALLLGLYGLTAGFTIVSGYHYVTRGIQALSQT